MEHEKKELQGRLMFRGIKRIIMTNRLELRFVFLFVLIFVVIQSLYYFSNVFTIPYRLQKVNALVSSTIINTVTPRENTTAEGRSLKWGVSSVEIGWGCEGIEGIFIIIAALSAYYMGLREKLLGILVGTLFLYCLNIARIVMIYYTIRYKSALFDIMHMYVGQTFIIFFGVLFFVVWIYAFSAPLTEQRK